MSATSVLLLRCSIIRYFIITVVDIPLPPVVTLPTVPLHPNLAWPTASGITEIQAREICQAPILEAAAVFELCSSYTMQSFETITTSCVLDLLVRNSSSLLLKTEPCVVSVASSLLCSTFVAVTEQAVCSSIPTSCITNAVITVHACTSSVNV